MGLGSCAPKDSDKYTTWQLEVFYQKSRKVQKLD